MKKILNLLGLWFFIGLVAFLLLTFCYKNFVQESQADILINIEEGRASMEALNLKQAEIDAEKAELGKKMDAEKMKLTAETCKEQVAKGTPENCIMDFT